MSVGECTSGSSPDDSDRNTATPPASVRAGVLSGIDPFSLGAPYSADRSLAVTFCVPCIGRNYFRGP
jgi:hypothetical protein